VPKPRSHLQISGFSKSAQDFGTPQAVPSELGEHRAELSRIVEGLTAALDDVREIALGIHRAILSEGGPAPALKTLARRSPIPVALDVRVEGRLPDGV
jgi:hypothetical protein